jgi:hypothetical protein
MPTPIYHLTHINNLTPILNLGGLIDPNRKCRRQAEFLVHQFFSWRLIKEIGVINSTIQAQLQQILKNFNHQPPVRVYSNWYY